MVVTWRTKVKPNLTLTILSLMLLNIIYCRTLTAVNNECQVYNAHSQTSNKESF